jgi:PmbA protein
VSELEALTRKIAERAESGEDVEVYASRVRETDVKIFDADVESLTVAERGGVGVRVVVDHRQGFAWAGSLEPDVVEAVLAEARDNAEFATPDEHQGMASRADVVGVAVPPLDLWREELEAVLTTDKVALALEAEAATLAADDRVRGVESASYGDALVESAVATSTGVAAATRRTMCSLTAFALAGEGDETQTGYGFSAARSFAELDPGEAARDAAERAVRMLGATQPRSARLPVIFDPLVTRSLLAMVGATLGAESVLKGRSVFVGREGETIASPVVTLVDDPTIVDAFGAAAHDAEGVPTRRNVLLDAGVLSGFLHNTTTGRRAGTGTTGSAVRGGFASTPGTGARALALTPGSRAPSEIIASAGDALYVHAVSGLHSGTNPVSGDFSVGAEGLMVRGGALAEPVRELTVASTLPRMLLDVAEVADDLEWLPGGAAGVTLLITEMSLAGA